MKSEKPWKAQLIDSLGLKNMMIRNYIFRPPNPAMYRLEQKQFNPIIKGEVRELFPDVNVNATVLRNETMCCPVLQLQRYIVVLGYSAYRTKSNGGTCSDELSKGSTDSYTQNIGDRIVIVYSHGNASDLGDVYYFGYRMVMEYGVDFIGYDYTGYGIGLGKHDVTERQTYEDLQAVLAYTVGKLGYPLSNVVLWGFSLGSGPTTEIASRFTSLGGVVLQSPLASMYLWLDSNKRTVKYDGDDIYQNINKIQAIKGKVLILHGEEDTIINIRHSEMLYEKHLSVNPDGANIWFVRVNKYGHNDLQQVIEQGENNLAIQIHRFIKHLPINVDVNPREITLLKLFELDEHVPKQHSRYQSSILYQNKSNINRRSFTAIVPEPKSRFGLCICQHD